MKIPSGKYWLSAGIISLIVSIYGCKSASLPFQPKLPLPASPQASGSASKKSDKSADSSSSKAAKQGESIPGQERKSTSQPRNAPKKQVTEISGSGDSKTKTPVSGKTDDDDLPSFSATPNTDNENLDDIDSELNASIAAFERRLAREKPLLGQSPIDPEPQQMTEHNAGSRGALKAQHRNTNSSGAGLIPARPIEQQTQDVGNGLAQESRARASLGNGDDVLERQLREAAERETDPELSKKLWEEYQKYTDTKPR